MAQVATKDSIVARVRALAPAIRERAAAAEANARLPQESVDELLQAGLARILMPRRFGGYELGFDTWLEVVIEVAKADASHGWCASLMTHHAHYLAQFPEAAQEMVWVAGPDVAIATALEPRCAVVRDGDAYRVSGRSPFTSGVLHSSWVLVGGMLPGDRPEAALFLIAPDDYEVDLTWFTTAMRATGSNTVVTDGVLVPADHVLRISELREGAGPGGALHPSSIYRSPWMSYAPLTFAAPIVGAARGAGEELAARLAERAGRVALGAQTRFARAAADVDAAELLLRRAADVAEAEPQPTIELRARTMRDCSRASELALSTLESLIALSGSSGFAAGNRLERAWRDAHFAATHIALNPDNNLAHWGRTTIAIERPAEQTFY
jgi:3-hydroxy-9,10-secoandrosta-1,3,5(10)-triene-9,17-dione monooxygenase